MNVSEVLITSSVLICIIILLRALLKNRVSAVFIYSLWLLAALRLLLPLELAPSAMSVMNVVPRANIEETPALRLEPPESEIVLPATPEVGLHGASSVGSVDTEIQQGGSGAVHSPGNTGHRPDTQMLLRAIWLLGAAVMAVYLLAVNGRMYLKLRGERRCVEIVGVDLRVYLVDTLPSPCLFGLFRPSIYISTAALEDEERTRMVVLHEQMHYRHGDHIWTLLRCVLLCVYWFNLFVWIAAYLSRSDAELACDESCVKALGDDRRLDYGRALVDMLDSRTGHAGMFRAATTMSGGKRAIQERVKRIAKAPKTRVAAVSAAVVLVLVAVICTFTGARDKNLVTDPNAYLKDPTAFARMSNGEIVSNDTGNFYSIDSDGTLVFHYKDTQTVSVGLPVNGHPGVFMSDTVVALSFMDGGTIQSWVSRNRGEDWYARTEVASILLPDGGYTLTGFSTANNGWILWASSETTSQTVRVWLTEDGGKSWTEVPEVYMRLGETGDEGIITGFAVSPTGTAYAAVSRSNGSSYFTWNTNVTTPLYGFHFTPDNGEIDGSYTASTPVVTESGVEFVYTTPNGIETVNNEHVEGNWHIPESWREGSEFIDLPGGVHVALATDELLAQFWDTLTLTSEGFEAGGEIGENTVLLYVENKLDLCGVFDIEDDIAWLAPEDVRIDHHLTYVPNAAVLIELSLDEEGHSNTGIRTHNSDYNEYAYRLDIIDGRLTVTPTGLGYDTDSNTAENTGHGLLLDYAYSSTAAAYSNVATIDAGGSTDISLCARESINSLYIVALDYSSGYIEPYEGERLYSAQRLDAGQSVTIRTDLSTHGGFGFIFVGSDGNPYRYYLNTSDMTPGGALDIQTIPRD